MLQRKERERRWHWREMQVEIKWQIPTKEPARPKPDAEWYDPATGCLYVWDGCQWVCEPSD
jgi:hypothetical protein